MEIMEISNLEILNKFRNKKVFITGSSGFKGAWLSYLLDKFGAKVHGFSLSPDSNPFLFNQLKFTSNFKFENKDINDYKSLTKSLKKFKPDYIFHLAAESLVLKSYRDPYRTHLSNYVGVLNILENLRNISYSPTTVFITTDKVYLNDDNKNKAFKETDSLGGKDPYSASKSASEILIKSYYVSFLKDKNIPISSARAGNVIGGGDWSENRLIPDLMKNIFEKKPVNIRNINATRPWQYILDILFGYLRLAYLMDENSKLYSSSWNFGPDDNNIKSVNDILQIISSQDLSYNLTNSSNKENQEQKYLSLDSSKAKKILKWKSLINFNECLELTCNWYKNFYLGVDTNYLLDNDIKNYLKI